jgi:broad specificity phosphatase PhoE
VRLLYVIRHASPQIQPDVPARDWRLSERGIAEARALAAIAADWGLRAVYTSAEPKAQSTALLIAEASDVATGVVDGFEELRFDEWIGNSDRFGEAVRTILERPDEAMRGAETAAAAAARFATGVRIVEQGALPAAAVSHGRVLTAYLAQALRLDDPYALWRSMPMPGWACVDLDGPKLLSGFQGLPE